MKRYLTYIKESRNDLSSKWFNAVVNQYMDEIKSMIKQGIDINMRDKNFPNTEGSALIRASSLGCDLVVKLLLQQPGIDVNMKTLQGSPALNVASWFALSDQKRNIIKSLLMHPNIDITTKDKEEDTYFIDNLEDVAFLKDYQLQKKIVENGRMDIIQFLDKYNLAIPGILDKPEQFFKAHDWGLVGEARDFADDWFMTDNIFIVKSKLKKGIDINLQQNKTRETKLIKSAFYDQKNIVKYLLEQPDIDPNIQSSQGNTALIDAASNGNKDVMIDLLKHPKIDVTIKNNSGEDFVDNMFYNNTFLINYELQKKILENEREDILFFFDKYGLVQSMIKDENPDLFKAHDWGLVGEANLSLEEQWFKAIYNDDIDKAEELIAKGIDVNMRDRNGFSALFKVQSNEMFDLLLEQPNIDINILTPGGTGLLHSYAQKNFQDREFSIRSIKTLLLRPEIDVTIKDDWDANFIRYLYTRVWLRDYDLQKKILENGREDIILFLDRFKLADKNIKKENPDLFKAKNWGLVS